MSYQEARKKEDDLNVGDEFWYSGTWCKVTAREETELWIGVYNVSIYGRMEHGLLGSPTGDRCLLMSWQKPRCWDGTVKVRIPLPPGEEPIPVTPCPKTWGLSGTRCILEEGHKGQHLYRCCGASCPGLPWAASEVPHPADCSLDRSLST